MTLTKSATTSVGIASKMQQISSKFLIYDAFFNKKKSKLHHQLYVNFHAMKYVQFEIIYEILSKCAQNNRG